MLARLHDLTVRSKLTLLVGVFVVGFAAFGLSSQSTLNLVRVGGPYYRTIVQGKDVIADVVPPPEYLLEAYLVVLQMADETDPRQLQSLAERSQQVREEYEARHEFWMKDLPEGRVKELMTLRSYKPAMAFFDIRDRDFIPAILRDQRDRARETARGILRLKHEEHLSAILQVVQMAKEGNKDEEQRSEQVVRERTSFLFILGCVIVGIVSLL